MILRSGAEPVSLPNRTLSAWRVSVQPRLGTRNIQGLRSLLELYRPDISIPHIKSGALPYLLILVLGFSHDNLAHSMATPGGTQAVSRQP